MMNVTCCVFRYTCTQHAIYETRNTKHILSNLT